MIYNTALTEEKQRDYLDYVKSYAQQYREHPFQKGERYLVLSTCTSSSTNGRHVLIGCIKEETENMMIKEH